MKDPIVLTNALIAVFAYTYLIVMLVKSTGEGLSFTTFALWGMLAAIIGISMWKQGSNPLLPAIYGTGAIITSIILFRKGRIEKKKFDLFIVVLVVICVFLWFRAGVEAALIFSVLAAGIAPIPFIVKAWQKPEATPILTNASFLAANIMNLAVAKSWLLEDRLYPFVNVVVCILLVFPWLGYQVRSIREEWDF